MKLLDNQKKDFYAVIRLSENIYKDTNGSLVCKNAVLGKSGTQAYTARELGVDSDEVVLIDRPEEEVFNDTSLASLEGKPLTIFHPEEDVTVDNYSNYNKGFVQGVRRKGNLIIGDLRVYDKEAIRLITSKEMVELSLGYNAVLVPDGDKKLRQTDIVYNHVALVPKGRAKVSRIIDMLGGEQHQIRDRQFELEEDTLSIESKEGFVSKLLSSIGLKAKKLEDGTEAYVFDAENQEKDVEEVTEEVTNDETNQDIGTEENTVTVTDEDTEETEAETNTEQDEEVEEVDETPEADTEPEETTLSDKETSEETEEGDEQMSDFEKLMAQAKEIDSINDPELRKSMKDSLDKFLKGTDGVGEEQDDNSALEKFKTPKFDDNEVEKYDFNKEYKQMLDDLDPHNPKYETFEDYRKARKVMERENSEQAIQELFEDAMEGQK